MRFDDDALRVAQGSLTPGGWLVFYNDTNETVPPFGLLRIHSAEIQRGLPLIKCRKPDTTFSRLYAINDGKPVAYQKRGRCRLLLQFDVQYDDAATPELLQGWGPKNGSWKATKGYPGFTIIGAPFTTSIKVSGTATSIKLVRVLQQPCELLAKTDAAINKGASGACSIYAGTAGSEVDTGVNVTAWNKFDNVEEDKWVGIFWSNNAFYLGQKEC